MSLLVTADLGPDRRRVIEETVPETVELRFLDDVDKDRSASAVAAADGLLSMAFHQELSDSVMDRLHAGQVLQTVSAGVDFLPFDRLPAGMTLLSNAGAYAEPMAEHVLALYLALAKRLLIEHRNLEAGEFNQFEPNHRVEGSRCTIFGFGTAGEATARCLKPLGVEVVGLNRSGTAEEPVAFLGTPDDLEEVLPTSDALVLTAPLTSETRGVIDRAALQCLPDDGMIINVARGELIDQADLYEHLTANPAFQAGIESWWTEPLRHGEFSLEYPLLDLPNVLGCPHNAAQVPAVVEEGTRRAVENLLAAITGGEPSNRVDRELGY